MNDFLKKILGDKKEWRRMEARAEALPSDYRIVYGEIKRRRASSRATTAARCRSSRTR